MPTRLCSHIQPDGHRCGAVALAGKRLCYFHARSQARGRRQQSIAKAARWQRNPANLSRLASRVDLSAALTRIVRAVAAGTLDCEVAASLLARVNKAVLALNSHSGEQPLSRRNSAHHSPADLPSHRHPPTINKTP